MKTSRIFISTCAFIALSSLGMNAMASGASANNSNSHSNSGSKKSKIDKAALKDCLLGIRNEMKEIHSKIVKACKDGAEQPSCDLAKTEAEATHSALHEKMKTCVKPASGTTTPAVAQVGQ